MDPEHLTQIMIEYHYWILIPLSLIEGPVVAFVAGTLASLGYFNIYTLALVFFVRDMGMDAVYYSAGYWGVRSTYVERMLKRIGIEQSQFETVRTLWEQRPGRTMFLGKLSYGIASSFVVLAGSVRMSLTKFFGWGAVVAVIEFGSLLLAGYLFGSTFSSGETHLLENVLYSIGGITCVGSGYYVLSFFLRKRGLQHMRLK